MGETGVSGLIVGDVKGTEEEKEKDHHPPHLKSPPTFQPWLSLGFHPWINVLETGNTGVISR